jgi:hypothetical protein
LRQSGANGKHKPQPRGLPRRLDALVYVRHVEDPEHVGYTIHIISVLSQFMFSLIVFLGLRNKALAIFIGAEYFPAFYSPNHYVG